MAMVKVLTKMTSMYPNSTEKQQNKQKANKQAKSKIKRTATTKKSNKKGRVYVVKNRPSMMKNAE